MTRCQEQRAKLKEELAAHARAVHKTFWVVSAAVCTSWVVFAGSGYLISAPQSSHRETASQVTDAQGHLLCHKGMTIYTAYQRDIPNCTELLRMIAGLSSRPARLQAKDLVGKF
jgi:hypothetical protein